MIKIGPIQNKAKRDFTREESQELLGLWHKITKKASDRSIQLASAYGKLDSSDPEWTILAKRVDDCIQNWASKVRRLGGEPRAMWTIVWVEQGQTRVWSLSPKFYASDENVK